MSVINKNFLIYQSNLMILLKALALTTDRSN